MVCICFDILMRKVWLEVEAQEVLFVRFRKTIVCFMQVIIGAHAVMANGGVIAAVGSHMVALAAHHHAVPFVVLAGLHKVENNKKQKHLLIILVKILS